MIDAAWVQFHKSHKGKKIKGVAACKAELAFLADPAPVCFTQRKEDKKGNKRIRVIPIELE